VWQRRNRGLFQPGLRVRSLPSARRPRVGRRDQQSHRGVVGAAVRRGAPGRPGRKLASQPVHIALPEHLGKILAERARPHIDDLRVGVSVGGEQHGTELVLHGIHCRDAEVSPRIAAAQAGRHKPVELRIGGYRLHSAAVGPDGNHVAVADLRQHQPVMQHDADQQRGTIRDRRVVAWASLRLLCLGEGVGLDIGQHGLPPAGHDGWYEELFSQLGDLSSDNSRSRHWVRLGKKGRSGLKPVGELLRHLAADRNR